MQLLFLPEHLGGMGGGAVHERRETLHACGWVLLAAALPAAPPPEEPPGERPGVTSPEVYGVFFYGPSFRVLEAGWRHGEGAVGREPLNLPLHPLPPGAPGATDPRRLELCFQLAAAWRLGRDGNLGLPRSCDRISWGLAADAGAPPAVAIVEPRDDGAFDARVLDREGRRLLTLTGYRTVALPGTVDGGAVRPFRAALADAAPVGAA